MVKIFCGVDWGERHHQVALVDAEGQVVANRRISDDLAGFDELTGLLAEHDAETPAQVALETDRGLLVAALVAAGHLVFSINPKAVNRYRDRYAVSGAKSDPGDALVLAHLLRTDAVQHRPIPADSVRARAIAVLARAHQDAVWTRQRDVGRLRSLLREFFPAALEAFANLTTNAALAILAEAPTPTAAAALTPNDLARLLGSTGRGVRQAEVTRLSRTFAAEQLHQPAPVENAMGTAVQALLRTITETGTALRDLEAALAAQLAAHPDAEILQHMPGLGVISGGRILGEFGDDPTRFTDTNGRRCYAGTAPVTRASGKSRLVMLRRARNQRLSDACRWWAFAAIHQSAGARGYYQRRRATGDTHETALRKLANKLIGQLHHCLNQRELYREDLAWPPEPAPT